MAVKKSIHRCFSLLAVTGMVGCATFQDMHYEHTQKFRTECAYWNFRWASEEHISSDYSCGWKAGYLDVLTGGNGSPPLVAPKKYWAPSQITTHLDAKRQEWYLGFQDGAMMASLEPDTHYVKVWGSSPVVQAGYYETSSPDTGHRMEPEAAPPVEGKNLTPSPSKDSGWEPAPGSLRKLNVPPIPSEPERWKEGDPR